MPAKPNQKIPKPYLWDIPPVSPPDPDVEKKLDPWDILEFLRIEALLRSSLVMELYKKNEDFFKEVDRYWENSVKNPFIGNVKFTFNDKLK